MLAGVTERLRVPWCAESDDTWGKLIDIFSGDDGTDAALRRSVNGVSCVKPFRGLDAID